MTEKLQKLFYKLGYTKDQANAIRSAYPVSSLKDYTLLNNMNKVYDLLL